MLRHHIKGNFRLINMLTGWEPTDNYQYFIDIYSGEREWHEIPRISFTASELASINGNFIKDIIYLKLLNLFQFVLLLMSIFIE